MGRSETEKSKNDFYSYSELKKQCSKIGHENSFKNIVVPFAGLSFLRWADRFETEQETAGRSGPDYKPTLPAHLRWHAWSGLRGPELVAFLRNELLPAINNASEGSIAPLVKNVGIAVERLIAQPEDLCNWIIDFVSKKKDTIKEFKKGILPVLLIAGIFTALIYPQPDFGNAAFLCLILITFLYIAGARLLHLALLGSLAIPAVLYAIFHAGYRHKRLLAFLNPWKDPRHGGFQIIQSFLSLGSGQLFGRGLGNGQQKLFFLPSKFCFNY